MTKTSMFGSASTRSRSNDDFAVARRRDAARGRAVEGKAIGLRGLESGNKFPARIGGAP